MRSRPPSIPPTIPPIAPPDRPLWLGADDEVAEAVLVAVVEEVEEVPLLVELS